MKKLYTLLMKLKIYAASVGLLLFFNVTNAQVIYYDLNPDVTVTVTSDDQIDYNVDINGDGTEDFQVRIIQYTDIPTNGSIESNNSVYVNGLAPGCDVAVNTSTEQLANAYNLGDPITSINAWSDISTLCSKGTVTTSGKVVPEERGNFQNSTGKYVGVKVEANGQGYYGYIGINTSTTSFTIRDFALNKTGGAAILAGEVATSISKSIDVNTGLKYYNNTIVAEFANMFNGKIEVINMNGQIYNSKLVMNSMNASVPMLGAPSGIYQVVVSSAEGYVTKRFFITGM